MQTLILEGIATSGKSTIINILKKSIPKNKHIKIIPEVNTIMVVADNTNEETSISHLKTLIDKAYEDQCDIVIFDRLYLTHAFRTHSTIQGYNDIEKILKPYSPITIYLKVEEKLIAERVQKASEHRKPEWKEYISTKGKSFQEIADYYIGQQRNQLNLLRDSNLPYKIYDTSNHNYEDISKDILTNLI